MFSSPARGWNIDILRAAEGPQVVAKSNEHFRRSLFKHFLRVGHCLKVCPGILNEKVPRSHENDNGNVVSGAIDQSVWKINRESHKHGRPRDESWGHKQGLAWWLWCWFLRFCGGKKRGHESILLVLSQNLSLCKTFWDSACFDF